MSMGTSSNRVQLLVLGHDSFLVNSGVASFIEDVRIVDSEELDDLIATQVGLVRSIQVEEYCRPDSLRITPAVT